MGKVNLFSQCEKCCNCCEDCLNNNDENTNNSENITNEEENLEKKLFDLSQQYDLNNFNLDNLRNLLIQVLSERFYECQDTIHSNILTKTKDIDFQNSFDFTKKEDFNEQTKIIEEHLLKNIKKLSKENFDKINNEYNKLLATFFLSDEDYDKYITEQVEEMKKNFSKSENTDSINDFVNGMKQNENFKKNLEDYLQDGHMSIYSKIENYDKKTEDISSILKKCQPYKNETFRGTGIYKKGKRIENKDKKIQSNIKVFLNQIENCTWKENGLKSYSSDPIVAAFFAFNATPNFFSTKFYNIFLHCHLNKTGVNLLEAYNEEEKYKENSFSYNFRTVNEKEVLYPEGSIFKILGIHIKIKEAYVHEIGGKYYNKKFVEEDGEILNEDILILDENQIEKKDSEEYINKGGKEYKVLNKGKKVFFPFIVLDLVQIE